MAQKKGGYFKFWGTRGSLPICNKESMRYGGNTSCAQLLFGNDTLIIDAGTGIAPLGLTLPEKGTYHLLLSHTHLDHVTGLPFFAPLQSKECTLHIYAPTYPGKTTEQLFEQLLDYAFFPIKLTEMGATIHFHTLTPGIETEIGQIKVHCAKAKHPSPTLLFRFHVADHIIGYATDNELTANQDLSFFEPCTLVIHETQYTDEEYQTRKGFGHTPFSLFIDMAKKLPAKTWYVTHHDPKNSDAALDDRLKFLQTALPDKTLAFASDNLTIDLE